MELTVEDLTAMERLHVKAWPAFETADIQGWLWRYSGGGSQRANSVSTIDFTGGDPAGALDEVEARYRAKDAPARVHTFDSGAPPNLADVLSARGYGSSETTLTMVKPVGPTGGPSDVEVTDRATAEWNDVYLGAITESRRAVAARILETIPRRRAFFTCQRRGQAISTGLCVSDGTLGVVECMATRLECSRQGGADAILRALECWANAEGVRLLGLQVVATNAPAVALYRGLGYSAAATNRFWVRETGR
jgi:GNAT superfamily N-acetyltransferase